MANQSQGLNEDRVACLIGGFIFLLGMAYFWGVDLIGWICKTCMWVGDPMKCFQAAHKGYM